MSGTVYVSGGFGDSSRSEAMSDGLRRRMAAADAEFDRQAASEARERRERAEEFRARCEQAAVADAVERGVTAFDALRGRNVGHTHGEFVARVNAEMDLQDAWSSARERAEFNRWQQEQVAESTAHTSDLEAEAASRAAHHAEFGPRAAETRRRRIQAQKVAQAVVRRELGRF